MPQVRKSRQRDAILQNLQNRCDHPTAMELYLSVREDFPNLSLGTLYRNLKGLCDNGVIVSLSSGGEEHYDAVVRPHAHLRCEKCNRFYDLPDLPEQTVQQLETLPYAGKLNGYSLIFFGVCEHCCKADENRLV